VVSWWSGLLPEPNIRKHLLRDEGEVIVDEVAHHWVAFARSTFFNVVGLMLMLGTLWVDADLGWIVFLAGLVVFTWSVYEALEVQMDRFVVTNMRVFRVKGVFAQSLATMPLSRILDITVQKPLMGRIFGYGHFIFESAAQAQGLRDIRTVGRVDERDLTIQRVVQRAGLRGPRVN
jgi:membrane protein YdbS with pleckstrin-like domain